MSLHDIGGMPAPSRVFATFVFCAFLALFPALAGWLQARIPAPLAVRALPADSRGVDAVRVDPLVDLHRLSVALVRLRVGGWPLQGYAPLGGVFRFPFSPSRSRGLLWLLVRAPRNRVPGCAMVRRAAGGWRSVAPRAMDLAERRADERRAAAGKHRAVAQVRSRALRARRSRPTRALAEDTRAQLIVLPETAVPHFLDRSIRATSSASDGVARQRRRPAARRADAQGAENYYNSVLTLGVSPHQSYHKRASRAVRRVRAAGLRLDARTWSTSRCRISRAATPAQPPLEVAGQRIAVNICYEDVFGDEIAQRACRRHAARQHVERRLVRRLARAGAAPADCAPARARDRAHAPHRDQYRHHRRDRPRRPRARRACRSSPRRASRSRRRATRERRPIFSCATGRSLFFLCSGSRYSTIRGEVHSLEFAAYAHLPATDPAVERILGPGKGCALLQPYDMEVGAGTFHTATFLRAIGPEPWNAAYVQPSRRPEGRPLRREPEPAAALLPVPGGAQALARRHPGSLPRLAARARHRSARARHPLRRGRLGIAHARRLGPGLGSLARRHGGHAVHLLPAGRRPRLQAGARARSPTASSASRCTCRARTASTTWCGSTGVDVLRRRLSPERSRAVALQLRARRTCEMLFGHFDEYEGEAKRLIEAQCGCRPTRWC